jgi:hypothetical protein
VSVFEELKNNLAQIRDALLDSLLPLVLCDGNGLCLKRFEGVAEVVLSGKAGIGIGGDMVEGCPIDNPLSPVVAQQEEMAAMSIDILRVRHIQAASGITCSLSLADRALDRKRKGIVLFDPRLFRDLFPINEDIGSNASMHSGRPFEMHPSIIIRVIFLMRERIRNKHPSTLNAIAFLINHTNPEFYSHYYAFGGKAS